MDTPNELILQNILRIASQSFGKQILTSEAFTGITHIFKEDLHNHYVAIRKLETGLIEITFFKSNRKEEKLVEDYVELGISFYPVTISDVQTLFKTVNIG